MNDGIKLFPKSLPIKTCPSNVGTLILGSFTPPNPFFLSTADSTLTFVSRHLMATHGSNKVSKPPSLPARLSISAIRSMSSFIPCKSVLMLLSLSSWLSNKHMSVSFSSTTLLTFIKESCTCLTLQLRCSSSMINLTSGLPSPLSNVWGITGTVVPNRPSSCSSLSIMSETQSTCSSKTASSDSKVALSSPSIKLRTSTWHCSNWRSCFLASSFWR